MTKAHSKMTKIKIKTLNLKISHSKILNNTITSLLWKVFLFFVFVSYCQSKSKQLNIFDAQFDVISVGQ